MAFQCQKQAQKGVNCKVSDVMREISIANAIFIYLF